MLPVRGKTWQHCWAPRGHKKCFWRFSETFFVSRTQNLCPPQMLRAWQNESTFGKHDHVSNVAATLCPRFAGPLYYSVSKSPLRCFFLSIELDFYLYFRTFQKHRFAVFWLAAGLSPCRACSPHQWSGHHSVHSDCGLRPPYPAVGPGLSGALSDGGGGCDRQSEQRRAAVQVSAVKGTKQAKDLFLTGAGGLGQVSRSPISLIVD